MQYTTVQCNTEPRRLEPATSKLQLLALKFYCTVADSQLPGGCEAVPHSMARHVE
jgi:hypothetical protein